MYKHIVLLTDGISEEGDSMTLTKEAQTNHVTISTVGLGQDVNRAFLEKVAPNAEGKIVFPERPLRAWNRSCCATWRSTPASPRWRRRFR